MCTKVSYNSKRQAKQAAYAIKAKGYVRPREFLNPYFCKSCQVWHLSKMTNEQYFHNLK